MVTAINQTYIDMIKAFREDCDNLIGKFKKENSKNIRDFQELWHSLNFNLVYDVKPSRHGLYHDFMHDTLQIAKLIMLREDFVGGMFLMYGLYCLQDNPSAAIRLEHDEYNYIVNTLRLKDEDFDKEKNHQLTYIFATLLKENAFNFVLFGREYDMEGQHRAQMIYENQYEFLLDENPRNVRPKDWLRNVLKDLPKEMKDLDNNYLKLKNKIRAVFPYLNLSLDMVEEEISTSLLKSITQADSMAEPQEADNSIGAKRRSLKNRKMKIKQRYRTESEEENVDEQPSNAKKRRGAPKGGRKHFFNQVINDPDLNKSSSDEEDKFVLDGKTQHCELAFPNLN